LPQQIEGHSSRAFAGSNDLGCNNELVIEPEGDGINFDEAHDIANQFVVSRYGEAHPSDYLTYIDGHVGVVWQFHFDEAA